MGGSRRVSLTAAVVLLLGVHASRCFALSLSSGDFLRSKPDVLAADDETVSHICQHLEGLRVAKVGSAGPAFACHLQRKPDHAKATGDATCSPVCAEPLDVVVVLGSSEHSLQSGDRERTEHAAVELLEHFELSRKRGSLFAFIDISHGIDKAPLVLSPLTDDRTALVQALHRWQPNLGGSPVPAAQLQGLENRPEVLALLKDSRSSVRQTLLVLSGPNPENSAFQHNEEIMQTLVSTCPAVVVKPQLQCGRMRWGAGEANGTRIKSWGDGHSK